MFPLFSLVRRPFLVTVLRFSKGNDKPAVIDECKFPGSTSICRVNLIDLRNFLCSDFKELFDRFNF